MTQPSEPPEDRVVYKFVDGHFAGQAPKTIKFVVGPAWKRDAAGNTVLVLATKPLEPGFTPTPTAYHRLRGNVHSQGNPEPGNPEPNWCEPVCECYCDCSTECVCDCDPGGSEYCNCSCSCYCVCDCSCECYCDCML